jgi:hypothetical protein
MLPRGSYFLVYAAGSLGISDEKLEKAIEWADRHDQQGREVFVGMNPRQACRLIVSRRWHNYLHDWLTLVGL